MTDTTTDPPHHQPRRGSDVEEFIKTERDKYAGHASTGTAHGDSAYFALDELLDLYRLCADTGSWLWENPSPIPEQ